MLIHDTGDLNLVPVTDPAIVNAIMQDEWVAPRMRHDDSEPGFIDNPAIAYSAAVRAGNLCGIFVEARHSSAEVEVHVAFPRATMMLARAFALEWLAATWLDPDLLHVMALPYASNRTVVNFARKLGFQLEGVRRSVCRRDGVPTDVAMMGMVRSEWHATLLMLSRRGASVH